MNLLTHNHSDPACRWHSPPATAFGRWLSAHRSGTCGRCHLHRARELFRRTGLRS